MPGWRRAYPYRSASAQECAARQNATETRADHGVLFVEDNEDVREAVGALLEGEGLEVLACASGEIAQDEFAKGDFRLLVTDVSLPSMSGVELARRLLRHRPDLWVVFLSGHALQDHVTSLGERVRFVLKPFTPEVLHDVIQETRACVG